MRTVSLTSIKKLLTAVHHMNNFRFNGNNYLQVGGTVMGTRLTPSYANLFMGRLEQKVLKALESLGYTSGTLMTFSSYGNKEKKN